jgi:hypothetical protein
MKINEQNICIDVDKKTFVSLKWYRGASRYNNGATIYGKKYFLRLVMGWTQNRKYTSKM